MDSITIPFVQTLRSRGRLDRRLAGRRLRLRARGGAHFAERFVARYARDADDCAFYRLLGFYERESALRFALDACFSAAERRRDTRDGGAAGSWEGIARGIATAWKPPAADEPGTQVRVETEGERSKWLRSLGRDTEAA